VMVTTKGKTSKTWPRELKDRVMLFFSLFFSNFSGAFNLMVFLLAFSVHQFRFFEHG
jgi:hypothetical protein